MKLNMKNIISRILIIISISTILVMGIVPSINTYLKQTITYEQYQVIIEILLVISFASIFYKRGVKQANENLNSMNDKNKKIKKEKKYKEDKNFYYREIPFNNDLFKTFWIAYQYNLIENKTNIINALLLKWHLEKRIEFVSKNKYIITNNFKFSSYKEEQIFELLKNTSKNKFKKITLFSSSKIINKIDEILDEQTIKFQNHGLIFEKDNQYMIKETIHEDVDKVYDLKNFLLNFSNIEDKSIKETILWEEYLIYAELFGITKKVKKELEQLKINYSIKETKYKRINKKMVGFLKGLLLLSYLFYIMFFIIISSPIVVIYAKLTWN